MFNISKAGFTCYHLIKKIASHSSKFRLFNILIVIIITDMEEIQVRTMKIDISFFNLIFFLLYNSEFLNNCKINNLFKFYFFFNFG
jgi:hypothetical protein